jgi:hypothetical protein
MKAGANFSLYEGPGSMNNITYLQHLATETQGER